MKLFREMISGMANIVDPDQTAPEGAVWSGSALFAYAILSEQCSKFLDIYSKFDSENCTLFA